MLYWLAGSILARRFLNLLTILVWEEIQTGSILGLTRLEWRLCLALAHLPEFADRQERLGRALPQPITDALTVSELLSIAAIEPLPPPLPQLGLRYLLALLSNRGMVSDFQRR